KAARKTNKHVPAYLTGRKFPPPGQPGPYGPGDEGEALNYVGSFLAGWKATPGAVAWLRSNVKPKRREPEAPPPKGPLGFVKKWLKDRLPQEYDASRSTQVYTCFHYNGCMQATLSGVDPRLQQRYEILVQEHTGQAHPTAPGPRILPGTAQAKAHAQAA